MAAVVIPAWAFPRITLAAPDGLYDVGRLDLHWTDSARNNRPIDVAVWYPAEEPNGRPLRYHPQPGVLGSRVRAGDVAARLHVPQPRPRRGRTRRVEPRFSVREGRSPIVLVATGTAVAVATKARRCTSAWRVTATS